MERGEEEKRNRYTCLIRIAVDQPIKTVAGEGHVVGFGPSRRAGDTIGEGGRRNER